MTQKYLVSTKYFSDKLASFVSFIMTGNENVPVQGARKQRDEELLALMEECDKCFYISYNDIVKYYKDIMFKTVQHEFDNILFVLPQNSLLQQCIEQVCE